MLKGDRFRLSPDWAFSLMDGPIWHLDSVVKGSTSVMLIGMSLDLSRLVAEPLAFGRPSDIINFRFCHVAIYKSRSFIGKNACTTEAAKLFWGLNVLIGTSSSLAS